jgi:hypothetical protein
MMFWIIAAFMPTSYVLLITTCFVLEISTAVAIIYTVVAVKTIRKAATLPTQHIAVGICYAWLFNSLLRIWSLLWLISGGQDWLLANNLVAFLHAGVALGGIYHLTSPGAFGRDMPAWRWITLAAVAGLVMVGIVIAIGMTPGALELMQHARPWLAG